MPIEPISRDELPDWTAVKNCREYVCPDCDASVVTTVDTGVATPHYCTDCCTKMDKDGRVPVAHVGGLDQFEDREEIIVEADE